MKLKKRKKATRTRGSHTHGWGFKKKHRGKGHRGGIGMAGSGKRADQKKTLIIVKYGNDYFGRDKALRRGVTRKRPEVVNIQQIIESLSSLTKKEIAKESKGIYEVDLRGYKILSSGEATLKLKIKASAASKAAIEKVKKAGGEILIE